MFKRIEVNGYRLLNQFSADLGPMTAVIGANATGKSSLFECLRLICRCAELPLETALGPGYGVPFLLSATGNVASVEWQLTFSKPRSDVSWGWIPIEPDRDYVFEAKLGADAYGQAVPVYECLRHAQPYAGCETPFKLIEATPIGCMIYDPRQRMWVPFDQAVRPESSDAAAAHAALSQERRLFLSQMRFFNEYPQPSAVRTLLVSRHINYDI